MRRPIWLIGSVIVLAGALLVIRARTGGNEITGESVVLLGDSITAAGDWGLLLPGSPMANRGFPGFTTEELIAPAEQVAAARPRAVVILAGTNDIRDGHPPSWTIRHLVVILDRLAARSPRSDVTIQSVLPRADAPDAVVELNAALEELANERNLRWVDLHSHFDNGEGGLRQDETTDGIHLSPQGYERWAAVLDDLLDELDR